jgi:hypothetical protein
MCDVQIIRDVFCRESNECFLVMASKYSLNVLLIFRWLKSLPVYSYISGPTFVLSLYINFYILVSFLLPLAWYSSLLVLPHLSVCMLSFLLLIVIFITYSSSILCLFVPHNSIELSHFHVQILGVCVCVCVWAYHLSVASITSAWHIDQYKRAQTW